MTEAVFDFPAINRRLMRKPEPVAAVSAIGLQQVQPFNEAAANVAWSRQSNCACPECVDAIAASEPTYSPSALNESAREFMANMAAAALRASLDETETVFIGWDVECPSSS